MEQGSWVGFHRLLRRVRDLMAGPEPAGTKLDLIATLIARDMVAEVCSIYVARPGDILELFATRGLQQTAVHKTRLRFGEGLVGAIAARARPLAVADARAHPTFAYRPETGEDPFASLMGVPILRGGHCLGVLAIQNRAARQYAGDEVEALETVAMVLAELLAVLLPATESRAVDGVVRERLEGLPLAPGLAAGRVRLHQPHIAVDRLVADSPAAERQRLGKALDSLRLRLHGAARDLSPLPPDRDADNRGTDDRNTDDRNTDDRNTDDRNTDDRNTDDRAGGDGATAAPAPDGPETDSQETREIIATLAMLARDRGWLGRIDEALRTGLTAEAAVQRVRDDTSQRMARIADPYLRDRMLDLEDLANRLLRELTGSAGDSQALPPATVLVARSIGPAELLDYPRDRLCAILLEEGAPTSHASIMARTLGIPMIGRLKEPGLRLETDDPVIVDADNGVVFLHPSDEVRAAFAATRKARAALRQRYAARKDEPPRSLDGVDFVLGMNAGLLLDMPQLAASGAAGVGLFRTETAFMSRAGQLDVRSQTRFYKKVLQAAGGQPVVFRTLDIGGDKIAPRFGDPGGANPAMGWRATRMALDRPGLLRIQLRALLRASAGTTLHVMFPMISELAEFQAARQILDHERHAPGSPPGPVRVGAMLEVPALAMQVADLAKVADFASVGSNDLMQFLFACDRGDPRTSDRYDPLSPPMLRFLRQIAGDCNRAGLPLALCGEMAGEPLTALALIGLGFRNLSMPAPALGPVRAMIRSLDCSAVEACVDRLAACSDHSVRGRLRAFAADRNIPV